MRFPVELVEGLADARSVQFEHFVKIQNHRLRSRLLSGCPNIIMHSHSQVNFQTLSKSPFGCPVVVYFSNRVFESKTLDLKYCISAKSTAKHHSITSSWVLPGRDVHTRWVLAGGDVSKWVGSDVSGWAVM